MGFQRPTGGNNSERVDVEKLGKGKFKGRLVAVANLGTYQDTYKGELKKPTHQMVLCVEVPEYPVDFGEGPVARKLWVKPFNFFSKLTEKGNELKHYKAFDEFAEENEVPAWDKQLGKGVYVIIKPLTVVRPLMTMWTD